MTTSKKELKETILRLTAQLQRKNKEIALLENERRECKISKKERYRA